jgi:gliding motility-associated-like protein
LVAQNCGCAAEGNCAYPFNANSTGQVCYEITDAFNDDLSHPAQGVCGVAVKFRHGRVGGLGLTLTSPDGTAIQLVGSNGSCNTWTPIALWDILFSPCAEDCIPDTLNGCSYPCVFNGCPIDCPWANANYSGTYHPYQGCLEDFDSGPVNGQWCLSIDNNAQFNGGVILDFQIILCDQSGILCCAADAGDLAFEPDVMACEGDSSLRLSPEPGYGALVPDTSLHGYFYLIFEDTVLLAMEEAPNLDTYPPGNYQVCGLSYLYSDSTWLPAAGAVLTPFQLDTMLHGPSPIFCGDVSDDCMLVGIASPIEPVQLNLTICEGDTIHVGNSQYVEGGQYQDTLASYFGCDSLVLLDLTVLAADTTFLSIVLCSGSAYSVGDSVYTASGVYANRLIGSNGCDSTVLLDLTILPTAHTLLIDTICNGDTVWIAGYPFYEDGTYIDTLESADQCDSIVTLLLTVISVSADILTPDTLNCVDTVIILTASGTSSGGTLLYSWEWEGSPVGMTDTVGLMPTANAGNYILRVSSGACEAVDSTFVFQDTVVPMVYLAPLLSDQLNCETTAITLEAVGFDPSASLTWLWMESGGAPVGNISPEAVLVTEPGEYILTVTNTSNECVRSVSRVIGQDTVSPTAVAGADTMFSCQQPFLQLNGSMSQANNGAAAYHWSVLAGGSTLLQADTVSPSIDGPGLFELMVIDTVNQCEDRDTVLVSADTIAPVPVLSTPQGSTLTCNVSILTLDATGSMAGPDFSATWTGGVTSGQGTLVATVQAPGTYSLVLEDNANGCTDSISLVIVTDTLAPVADAGPADTLSCTNNTSNLGGSGTSVGPVYSYHWTGSMGGSFISPTDMPTAEVDSAGTYYLLVRDLSNGCESMDTVTVEGNYFPPQAVAGPDRTLTCTETQVVLNAGGSLILPFSSYYWTNGSGEILSNNLTVTVDYADTFVFHLSFAFCQSRDSVVVVGPSGLPVAEAGWDVALDCTTGMAQLDGTGSETGDSITYAWALLGSTAGGQGIVQGSQTLVPMVDEVGWYQLTVTDAITACSASDTVHVWLDTAACQPFAWAGVDGLVNCYHQQVADTLVADGSVGPNISVAWTAVSGALLDISESYQPIVTPGTYVLTVTNEAVGLSVHDTVVVLADTVAPIASIADESLSLNCMELEGCYVPVTSGTTQGPGISYAWGTFDGSFCGSTDELATGIAQVGIYELIVTNSANGCTAADAIFITLEDLPAVANAGMDLQLPCSDTTAIPGAVGSSAGPQFQYEWYSTDGGIIVGGGNTLQPLLAVTGLSDTFYLEVTNSINFCRDTDEVVVFGPTGCTPQCAANTVGQLDCVSTTAVLSGVGSSQGTEIGYEWAVGPTGGNFCGDPAQQQVCIDSPGEYILTVTRTYASGVQFSKTCQVIVPDLSQPPNTDAGPDRVLNCVDTIVQLDGSSSAGGTGIAYQWEGIQGGGISAGGTTAIAEANLPGQYVLTVLDTFTGCSAADTVGVTRDTAAPVAEAGEGETLNCIMNTIVLNGSGMPAGASAVWETQDGDICAGGNTFSPIVCDAGTYILTVTHPENGCESADSVTVTTDGMVPNPDAGPDLTYTCAEQLFEITASVVGGSDLVFEWVAMAGGCIVGPSDQLQLTAACPGTYHLAVTDLTNGCQGHAEMKVVADTLAPVAHPGEPQEIDCDQLQVTLDGSGSQGAGGLAYSWSIIDTGHIVGGFQSETAQVDAAGNYQLLVTDLGNGCQDSALVAVTVDEGLPFVTAGVDTILTCRHDTISLDGTGTAVWPGLVYHWQRLGGGNLMMGQTLTPAIWLPGIYELEVSDTLTGCIVRDTVFIGVDTMAPVAAIEANEGVVINCIISQVTLDGQMSVSAGTLQYNWETAGGHFMLSQDSTYIQVDSGGIYILVVENQENGCRDTAKLVVVQDKESPPLWVGAPGLLTCREPIDTLWVASGGSTLEYEWSGPGIVTGADEEQVVVDEAGAYQVVVTDTVNGCKSSAWVTVAQNLAAPEAVATATGSFTCRDSVVVVSGDGSTEEGVTYEWGSADGASGISSVVGYSATVTDPGWYYLTVIRSDNGCFAVDSAEVTVSEFPISGLVMTIEEPDCRDQEGSIRVDSVLGGSPPYRFALDGGYLASYREFEYLDPGGYLVRVEDEGGCSWEEWVQLVQPKEVSVELGGSLTIRQGDLVRLTGQTNLEEAEIDTVIWHPGEDAEGCFRCLELWVSPIETTAYYLTVFDSNGCQATDKVVVFVQEAGDIYAPTAFSPDGDGVNDYFTLYGSEQVSAIREFFIYDRWGSLVFERQGMMVNNALEGWDGTFMGRPLDVAVYTWKALLVMVDGSLATRSGAVTLVR